MSIEKRRSVWVVSFLPHRKLRQKTVQRAPNDLILQSCSEVGVGTARFFVAQSIAQKGTTDTESRGFVELFGSGSGYWTFLCITGCIRAMNAVKNEKNHIWVKVKILTQIHAKIELKQNDAGTNDMV
ncbi:MAG: hypothetical protein ACI4MP_13945 [Candidatus Ventricola sp.]